MRLQDRKSVKCKLNPLMEAVSLNLPQELASSDELYMNEAGFFSDSLKDLKNLRKQLYSAAEYFELSYTNDDEKDIVVNTLKDYAVKAIVNTVDHLGSVSYKVNDLLDKKVDEVSGTEILVSCIQQRLKSCQEFIDKEGLSQQSSVMKTPKYHKRYILPVGETMNGANGVESTSRGCSLEVESTSRSCSTAVQASSGGTPPSTVGETPSPCSRFPQQNESYLISIPMHTKELEKRKTSSNRFPLLLRSGSVSSQRTTPKKSRPTTPNPSRPITPNPSSIGKQQKASEPQRSASMRFHTERFEGKEDSEHNHVSKSKRLLKALLSRRKSKRDDMLYTYLDEY